MYLMVDLWALEQNCLGKQTLSQHYAWNKTTSEETVIVLVQIFFNKPVLCVCISFLHRKFIAKLENLDHE